MNARLRIGLTGGIASGKSTVERRLTELGVPVINADDSARAVVARGQPGLAAVVGRFGSGVLTHEGDLDRPALRRLIFQSPDKRRDLEAVLHPLIRDHMEEQARGGGGPILGRSLQ
jgi:dephospho-CoA kinase